MDDIGDSTEIVVKPLNEIVSDINLYAGATILGDGSVALTLDINGIADSHHIQSNSQHVSESSRGFYRRPVGVFNGLSQ